MKYTAVIFDMDGTIVNTENIWFLATKKLIEDKGVIYTPQLHEELTPKIHGLALHQSCRIIKEMVHLEDHVDELIAEKSRIALSLYRDGISFIEGFPDFHRTVVGRELKHGIATNADDATVAITDEQLNLRGFFGDHIYGISCVNNVHKPNPAIYLHAASKLGVDPRDCIAIEDSAHGVKAAKAAGMYCIGINTAKNPHQLKEADSLVDAYVEINLEIL
jgi:beta-phosphoglucomutase-like phosphatase (HAD superfamily)